MWRKAGPCQPVSALVGLATVCSCCATGQRQAAYPRCSPLLDGERQQLQRRAMAEPAQATERQRPLPCHPTQTGAKW